MSAVKEKWTARGTGKCPKCSFTYSTFRKPPNCFQCNFFLGGKYVNDLDSISRKKKKLDNPSAVKVSTFGGNNLYSMKLTSRDDGCFFLVSDMSTLCYYSLCKSFRSVTAASRQAELNKFSCNHLEQVKQSVCAMEEYHLYSQQVSSHLSILVVVISKEKCLMQSVMPKTLVSLKSSEYQKPAMPFVRCLTPLRQMALSI